MKNFRVSCNFSMQNKRKITHCPFHNIQMCLSFVPRVRRIVGCQCPLNVRCIIKCTITVFSEQFVLTAPWFAIRRRCHRSHPQMKSFGQGSQGSRWGRHLHHLYCAGLLFFPGKVDHRCRLLKDRKYN